MGSQQIISKPFLFQALAGTKRQVRKVVRAYDGGHRYPSVLSGESKVRSDVPLLLTRVWDLRVLKPAVEKLSTPAFFTPTAIRNNVVKYPFGKFQCRKNLVALI